MALSLSLGCRKIRHDFTETYAGITPESNTPCTMSVVSLSRIVDNPRLISRSVHVWSVEGGIMRVLSTHSRNGLLKENMLTNRSRESRRCQSWSSLPMLRRRQDLPLPFPTELSHPISLQ